MTAGGSIVFTTDRYESGIILFSPEIKWWLNNDQTKLNTVFLTVIFVMGPKLQQSVENIMAGPKTQI